MNSDSRLLYRSFVNNIPTDIRGLSFARTPLMVSLMDSLGNLYHQCYYALEATSRSKCVL